MPADPISTYLQAITKNLARGNATEHTHRPALKALLESFDAQITATNEPQHIVDVGAPDFIVERGKTPLGYVETKEVGENLDKIEKSEQMQRYRAALPNLLLTDYLEFRWYVDGERRAIAHLGEWRGKKISGGDADAATALLQQFIAHAAPSIAKPKDLAERIAALAQLMRGVIEKSFAHESERGNLHEWLTAFQETLIPDLTPAQFADMFAQTIAYGMFAARANDPTPADFSRMEAAFVLPKTNPFLRKLFHEIAGPDLDPRVAWIADDLANLLARADMERVLKDFGKRTRREDPVVHFYETFLAAYDARLRKARGVYYTPEPVVSYIVRSVDHLLRKEFGKANGLADPSVLLLDPAVGTATFLYFVIQQIHETLTAQGQQGAWASYVAKNLLPRLFGFEILMAPYTVAHLKLGVELKELGYDFASEERLGIYLTNSLEQIGKESQLHFARFINEESEKAQDIKRNQPIMIVLGNPPYANFGMMNKGEWIGNLLDDYKRGLNEKKLNLDDDFIKFLRFGQWRIERSGAGILAFITNNTYIDGITHRRMRQSLLETFDDIYILDLHGSSKKKEKCPDGSKDENVFDIQQGVAIALFVREPRRGVFKNAPTARVHHAELWGARETKYAALAESDIATTRWTAIEPKPEQFFFVPKNFDGESEYATALSLKDIFPINQNGLKTDRDDLFLDFDNTILEERIETFLSKEGLEPAFRERYRVENSSSYDLLSRRSKASFDKNNICRLLYRPFDVRWIYYDVGLTSRPALETTRHMLAGQNVGLVTTRQVTGDDFCHVLCARFPIEMKTCSHDRGTNLFPLYLYDAPAANQPALNLGARRVNFAPAFIAEMETRLGLKFAAEGRGVFKNAPTNAPTPNAFTPEDLFHYIYAVLHAPTYRQRYAEFLKIDFPRVPLTRDVKLFRALSAFGAELVALHLLEFPYPPLSVTGEGKGGGITRFPVAGSNEVEKIVYAEEWRDASGKMQRGCVFVNKTQYFADIAPDVWHFHIGGYQVLDKWLKDRKGRALSYDDITHYQKIVVALKETLRVMNAIDAAIPKWPLE